jgi:hypothetical protein
MIRGNLRGKASGTQRVFCGPAAQVFIALAVLICASLWVGSQHAKAQEKGVTIEELLAKHLEAIGSAESRSRVTSRVASGKANLVIRLGGAANIDGQAMIISTGPKYRIGLQFVTQEYTGEDLAFDGSKVATGLLPQGRRSGLSTFFNSQMMPVREGLFCGVLSTAWPLLRVSHLQPKLEYRGVKKFLDRQLHEVGYRASKGQGEVKVFLYFDPVTFRHVASKYSFEVGAGIGSRDASNENAETYYAVTEMFDDFKAVDGIMLPFKYRIQHSVEGRVPSSLYDWTISLAEITHNQALDSQLFVIK